MRDPSVREAKWIYWLTMFAACFVGVVIVRVYAVPFLLVAVMLVLQGIAGVTKGHYDDV